MASKITWEWNDDGFKEILNCKELGDVCLNAAKKISGVADVNSKYGEYGYERWYSNMNGGRIAARVTCQNEYAKVDEATNRTLSKAAMSCRI